MIKPITTLALLYLIALMFTSCESDANFEVENGHTKLFTISEISPSEKVKVFVNTAIGTNTDDDFIYPKQKDVEVTFFKDGVAQTNPGFRYIPREKAFVSQGTFRPERGTTYGLQVEFINKSMDIPTTYAETFIPEKDSIVDASFAKKDNEIVHAEISLRELTGDYFSISFKGQHEFQVMKIEGSRAGLHIINDKKLLLIDKNKALPEINLTLLAMTDIHEGEIALELKSITADAYHYKKTFSYQLAEQTHLLYEPVIDRSNFENGLGLFAGYNSSRSYFEIK